MLQREMVDHQLSVSSRGAGAGGGGAKKKKAKNKKKTETLKLIEGIVGKSLEDTGTGETS